MERDPHDREPVGDTPGGDNLLQALPRRRQPPPALEDRVVGELRRAGLLAEPATAGTQPTREAGGEPTRVAAHRPWPRWALPLAAALAGMIVGWGGARLPWTSSPSSADGHLFILMFAGGPEGGEELARSIRANGVWAREVLGDRFLGGRKLAPEGTVVAANGEVRPSPSPRRTDATPIGFFVIRARDLQEATELGRSSPHLAFGGQLSVRPVDDLAWVYGRPIHRGG